MVEHLAQQTAGLVKVIGSVMLNPETVTSILQSEKEDRGATDGEGVKEAEPQDRGEKKKARPVYHNSKTVKMMEELQSLPNQIFIYNTLKYMEEKAIEAGITEP